MKMICITFSLLILCSVLVEIATGWLRGIDFRLSCTAGCIAYFVFTVFCVRRYSVRLKASYILCAILLGYLALHLPFRILYFQDALISLPDAACRLLGIITGFAFYCTHRRLLCWAISGVTLATCLFMSFGGYMMWIDKRNYGDIGAVTAGHSAMRFIDEHRDTLSVADWEGKIVVLDFWTTSCGICFKKFPQVQSLYDKYKDNSKVAFYAVNAPIERDNKDQLFNLLREKGYTFPVLLSCDSTSSYMKVRAYPTVLILGTTGDVAYRGRIEVAGKKIAKMLKADQK